MSSATKITGNQAIDVNERRLRPIYDSLDAGDNKKALQEADRILKKQKDLLCAKALKTLALIRLNRNEEALIIIEEVRLSKPVDDVTLQATSMCFRELQRLDYMVELYENAAKVKSDNEEILTHLFMSYVRTNNYQKQQQTAMLLHKLRPLKNPYYFWSVMSVYMQANDNKDLASKMLLPLAEKMILKYINENKIEAEAEIQLYLMVLKSMEKFKDCIDVIKGPLAQKLFSDKIYLDNFELDLLEKISNWQAVNDKCKALIADQPEQWCYYIKYFESFFKISSMESHTNGSLYENQSMKNELESDFNLKDVLEFLEVVLVDHKHKRIYMLVKMELISWLSSNNFSNWDEVYAGEKILDILKQFCEQFGTKQICFKDIQPYLKLLSNDDQNKLLNYLNNVDITNLDKNQPVFLNLQMMLRHQLFLQVSHFLGFHGNLTLDKQIELVKFLCNCYQAGLKFGEGFLTTDIQPVDFYSIIAATILSNIASALHENKFYFDAINLLELAKLKSPSNFQIKILLINLYAKIGALGPCIGLHESLDIKHIQLDSLGYIIFNHMTTYGHYKFYQSLNQLTLSFHNNTYKEISDYIIAAYKYGTFIKIEEFINFRDQLRRSYVYARAVIDKLLNDLIIANSEKEMCVVLDNPIMERYPLENIFTLSLSDNRDFKVVPCWLPLTQCIDDDLIKNSFELEKFSIQIRCLIVECLIFLVRSFNKNTDIETEEGLTLKCNQFNEKILKLKLLFENSSSIKHLGKECMYVTMQNDFLICTKLSLQKFLFIYFDFFQKLSADIEDKGDICQTNGELKYENYNELLKVIDNHLNELPMVFEMLSCIIEHVCIVSIILYFCYLKLHPVKLGLGGKKKKKGYDNSCKVKLIENYNYLYSCSVELVKKLLLKLESVKNQSINNLMQNLTLNQNLRIDMYEQCSSKIRSEIDQSYNQTISDFKTRLNSKLTFLQALKL